MPLLLPYYEFKGKSDSETEAATTIPAETELQKEVKVGDVDITGLSREAAREKILESYPWTMKVVWNEETIEIPNLIEPKVDELLQEIYHGVPKETYTLETTGLEEAVASQVSEIVSKWDKPAKNASISSFDKQSGKFVFTGEEAGQQVNQEALTAQIEAAIASKDFDAQITAEMTSVAPEITKEQPRKITRQLVRIQPRLPVTAREIPMYVWPAKLLMVLCLPQARPFRSMTESESVPLPRAISQPLLIITAKWYRRPEAEYARYRLLFTIR